MKKFCIVLATVLLLFSAGCSGKAKAPKQLDYNVMKDTETGQEYSLGEARESIERKLGEEGVLIAGGGPGDVLYLDDMFLVRYNGDDEAYLIGGYGERFLIRDFNPEMSEYEVMWAFPAKETLGDYTVYIRYYGADGNQVNEGEDFLYAAEVAFQDEWYQYLTLQSFA